MIGNGSCALRISDVSRQLNVSPKTIYRLVWRGQLRAVKIGRALRIPVGSLDEFLVQARMKAPATPPA